MTYIYLLLDEDTIMDVKQSNSPSRFQILLALAGVDLRASLSEAPSSVPLEPSGPFFIYLTCSPPVSPLFISAACATPARFRCLLGRSAPRHRPPKLKPPRIDVAGGPPRPGVTLWSPARPRVLREESPDRRRPVERHSNFPLHLCRWLSSPSPSTLGLQLLNVREAQRGRGRGGGSEARELEYALACLV
jgi:hypothetical protein